VVRERDRAVLLDRAIAQSYLSGVMPAHITASATSYYYYAPRHTGRVRSGMR